MKRSLCTITKINVINKNIYSSIGPPDNILEDNKGKPMIWWGYNRLISMNVFYDVLCAVNDERKNEMSIICTEVYYDLHEISGTYISSLYIRDFD